MLDCGIQVFGLMLTLFIFTELKEFGYVQNTEISIAQFTSEVWELLKNPGYLISMLSFCLFWGQIDVVVQSMGIILLAYNIDITIGSLFISAGMILALPLCVYLGYLNDRIKKHKFFINIFIWTGTASIFSVFLFY